MAGSPEYEPAVLRIRKSFANRLERDRAAVVNALSMEISNGQVEGQVNKLKLLKRSMFWPGIVGSADSGDGARSMSTNRDALKRNR